ncbi:MAG: transposase family protein [Oligoflexales bacterium]
MISFEDILDNPKKLNTMTGVCIEEFEIIFEEFEVELNQIRNPNRVKSGAPSKLTVKEKLLMVLIHYRHYQNFDVIGVIFNVDGSTVKRWLDSCESAIEAILEKKNFSHLIPRNQDPSLKMQLTPRQKSISMALNSL